MFSVTCCSKGYEGYLPLFGNWYVTSFYKFSWCLDFLKMKILSLFEGITRTDVHLIHTLCKPVCDKLTTQSNILKLDSRLLFMTF